MKRRSLISLRVVLALVVAVGVFATALPGAAQAQMGDGQLVYGLTERNELVLFDSAAPDMVLGKQQVKGLRSGERLFGIDFRPADGKLYGLGSSNRIYTIDVTSGQASPIGTSALTTTLQGQVFGVDFNPQADRLRVVSNTGQNLRLNQLNGAVGGIDGTLAYTTTDINAGKTPRVVAAGYTNNVSGTTSTVLYVMDVAQDVLAIQSPPNAGVLTTVGPLGLDVEDTVGFDIAPDGQAYAVLLARDGVKGSMLATVNLDSGSVTPLGRIGGGLRLTGFAIPTTPIQPVYGLTERNELVLFDSAAPDMVLGKQQVKGLRRGEQLFGIDFRPADGKLYGLGSSNRIYTIDVTSGQASPIGSSALTTTLQGQVFGVDFNPQADRLRVVSNTGQNLRLNQLNGAVGGIDGTLAYTTTDTNAGKTPRVAAAGYTNNVSGTTSTVLYVMDVAQDVLAIQSPPNAGVLTTVGPLGLDVEDTVGFDIAPDGQAYAVLLARDGVKGSMLATVNLDSGSVTPLGRIGGGLRLTGFAIPAGR
jgi:3D (Asp-Asp-Asp) domain-containing protein